MNNERTFSAFFFQFLDKVIRVNIINKIVIGKVLLSSCGNEGAEHDERTRSLRKLLQTIIDFIQINPHINWNNAEITVYDIDDNSFKIISGEGKHQYVVTDDGEDRAGIVNTTNKVQKQNPNVQPQPTGETILVGQNREHDPPNSYFQCISTPLNKIYQLFLQPKIPHKTPIRGALPTRCIEYNGNILTGYK